MPDLSVLRLLNGSTGDPGLYLDFPGSHDAVLVDAGDLTRLSRAELADVGTFLLTHHHLDHFGDFDRLLRYSVDHRKTIRLLGPEGTLDRLAARLSSFAYQRFPFMQLRFHATEVRPQETQWPQAEFLCQEGFARRDLKPMRAGRSGVVLTNPQIRVRVAEASHTTACLAYAVEIRRGWRFDPQKAQDGMLARGPWIGAVLKHLEKPVEERPAEIAVAGTSGRFRLRDLVRGYFSHTSAQKAVFITDTRREKTTWPGLVDLARDADWLFCDAYYPPNDTRGAEKHGHLTVTQTAELATEAGVKSLWLMHLGARFSRQFPAMIAAAQKIFPATHAVLSLNDPHPSVLH